jgi:hypothetical protein
MSKCGKAVLFQEVLKEIFFCLVLFLDVTFIFWILAPSFPFRDHTFNLSLISGMAIFTSHCHFYGPL